MGRSHSFRMFAAAALVTVSAVSSSHAIFGIGAHWGFDFSLSMDNVNRDKVVIPGLGLPSVNPGSGFDLNLIPGFDPSLVPGLTVTDLEIPGDGETDFVNISRTNFRSHIVNFGAKLYVDIIPFIDAVEMSFNLGLWQYDGAVRYLAADDPLAMMTAISSGGPLPYESLPLTLEEFDMAYFGMNGTPYAKLQFDASVRKTLYRLPSKIFRASAGAGVTLNFTTPLLSSSLVDGVRIDEGMTPEKFVEELSTNGSEIGEQIVQKIIDELFTPRWGMHIVAGVRVKPPVVPIALYVDGKFMIPFSNLDASGGMSGLGFLLNADISLSF